MQAVLEAEKLNKAVTALGSADSSVKRAMELGKETNKMMQTARDNYKQAQELGYATLSYMNVFEYGMNVLGGAKGAPVTPKPDDYRNATLCE